MFDENFTNQNAYENDLDEILDDLNKLLQLIPVSSAPKAAMTRAHAEALAGNIRTTIFCMKNDYKIVDC